MDPDVTWEQLIAALDAHDLPTARERAQALYEWLCEKDGFMPSIGNHALGTVLKWFAALGSTKTVEVMRTKLPAHNNMMLTLEATLFPGEELDDNAVRAMRRVVEHIQVLQASCALHPDGRCNCAGEGRCDWCQKTEAQERVHDLETKLRQQRGRQAHSANMLLTTHMDAITELKKRLGARGSLAMYRSLVEPFVEVRDRLRELARGEQLSDPRTERLREALVDLKPSTAEIQTLEDWERALGLRSGDLK